jgi:hypothetical protein
MDRQGSILLKTYGGGRPRGSQRCSLEMGRADRWLVLKEGDGVAWRRVAAQPRGGRRCCLEVGDGAAWSRQWRGLEVGGGAACRQAEARL